MVIANSINEAVYPFQCMISTIKDKHAKHVVCLRFYPYIPTIKNRLKPLLFTYGMWISFVSQAV